MVYKYLIKFKDFGSAFHQRDVVVYCKHDKPPVKDEMDSSCLNLPCGSSIMFLIPIETIQLVDKV